MTISFSVWITSINAHKYIILIVGGDERDSTPMRVLTSKIIELEKLQEVRMKVVKIAKI
jgi:hypothetical protein